jgi:hypothetical protein
MLPAETKNTSKAISRRSVTTLVSLAAIAAGAAAAIAPARASLPIGECSYPELADRFDALYARWRTLKVLDNEHNEEFANRLAAATGLDVGVRLRPGDPGWDDYLATFETVSRGLPYHSPVDEGDSIIAWDEIHDVLFPLVREIIRQPARSLLDLTLKARAIAVIEYDIWTEGAGEVRDIGTVAVRSLVDDLCGLAGIDVLPGIDLVPFVTIDECE